MKILLDENMPHLLLADLRSEGYQVESVHSLSIAGVKNGDLYRFAKDQFDFLFTKDVAFNEWARNVKEDHRVKYVLVTFAQASQEIFVNHFMSAFRKTNWSDFIHGNSWPN